MGSRDVFLRLREAAAAIIKKQKAFEKEKVRANVTRDTIEDQIAFDCGPDSNETMRDCANYLKLPLRKIKTMRSEALQTLETQRDQLRCEEAKWTDTVKAYRYLRGVQTHAASKQEPNIPLSLEKLFKDVTEIIQRQNAFEAEKKEKSVTCETIGDQIRYDCGTRPNESMRKLAAFAGNSMDELISSRKAVLKELQQKEDGLRREEAKWKATVDAYERIDDLDEPIIPRRRKRRKICYRNEEDREFVQCKVGQVVEIHYGRDDVRAKIVCVTGDSVTVRYLEDKSVETISGERRDRILRIVDDDDASDEEPSKSSATTAASSARMSVPASVPRASKHTSKYRGVNFSRSSKKKWHARLESTNFSKFFSSEEEAAKAYDAEARKKYGDSAVTNFLPNGEFNPKAKYTQHRTTSAIDGHGRNRSIGSLEEEPSKSSATSMTPNARMSVTARISVPAQMWCLGARASRPSSSSKCISKYKGVTKTKRGKWFAQLPKTKFAGRFLSEEEAAKAYDAEARKKFGDSAVTNFSLNGEFNPKAKSTTQGTASAVSAMTSPNASQETKLA